MPLDASVIFSLPVWVALVWLIAVAIRGVREPRILLFLVAWTAAEFATALLPSPESRRLVRAVLAVAIGVVLIWPERVGLLSIRGREAAADDILRRAWQWLRGTGRDPREAERLVSDLSTDAFPVPDPEWGVAAALFRRALLRAGGADDSTSTPSSLYARAGLAFWHAATDRHRLGPRFRPRVWDEAMALRCFYEDFHALVPRQALIDEPLVPIGDWDLAAEGVIRRLRDTPFDSDIGGLTREALAAAMSDELVLARGDRTEAAVRRQAISARQMTEHWAAIAGAVASAREAPSIARRLAFRDRHKEREFDLQLTRIVAAFDEVIDVSRKTQASGETLASLEGRANALRREAGDLVAPTTPWSAVREEYLDLMAERVGEFGVGLAEPDVREFEQRSLRVRDHHERLRASLSEVGWLALLRAVRQRVFGNGTADDRPPPPHSGGLALSEEDE